MSGPTERPVPDDSAPEQPAPDIVGATPGPDTTIDSMLGTPYGVERKGMFGVAGSGDTSGFGGLVKEPWTPPTAERPYGGYFDEIVDALYENLAQAGSAAAGAITKVVVDRGELTLHVEREHLLAVAGA